jgi:hypothetical protein
MRIAGLSCVKTILRQAVQALRNHRGGWTHASVAVGPEPEADSLLPARFWLTADIGSGRCKVKLPVLLQMTTGTERLEIAQGIIALLAPLDPVMDLQILQ